MIYGYARVSTLDQSLEGQEAELLAHGCERVFKEKLSGIKADRPELKRLVAHLRPGDVVVVCRLDRLARSTRDLLNLMASIAEKGSSFKSLKDAWADTTTPHGRLMLTVLGGLAEFEWELIKARTSEGRIRAKAKGVKFGRKPKLALDLGEMSRIYGRLSNGCSQAAIAKDYGVHQSTISRLSKGNSL